MSDGATRRKRRRGRRRRTRRWYQTNGARSVQSVVWEEILFGNNNDNKKKKTKIFVNERIRIEKKKIKKPSRGGWNENGKKSLITKKKKKKTPPNTRPFCLPPRYLDIMQNLRGDKRRSWKRIRIDIRVHVCYIEIRVLKHYRIPTRMYVYIIRTKIMGFNTLRVTGDY